MTYYNPTTNEWYRGGALRTADGTIFNPTAETLYKHGYEPYTPPKVEPAPLSKEEISAQRKQAYIQRVDPITAEISRLRDMGGTEDEIADAMARREQEVSAIKAELPYPSEGEE